MNIQIIRRLNDGKEIKIPLQGKPHKILVQPNEHYEVIDADTGKLPATVLAKKVANSLVFTINGEEAVVEFEDYYANCSADAPCSLQFQEAGADLPTVINQSTEVGRPLSPDEFLVYESSDSGGVPGWFPFASSAGAGGLAAASPLAVLGAVSAAGALGAAAGGGGGGGSSGGSGGSGGSGDGGTSGSSMTIAGSVTAGPMHSGVTIIAYGKDGAELGRASVASDGTYSIAVEGGYSGPILLKALDENGSTGNYVNETTGISVDLGVQLRAVAIATGSDMTANITPLTELVTRALGVGADNVLSVSEADISVTNSVVSSMFGVADILGNVVAVTDAKFNADDGLSPEEVYGIVLAGLSGADAVNDDGISGSLSLLSSDISISGGNVEIKEDAQDRIISGIQAFIDSAFYSKITQGSALLRSLLTIYPINDDTIWPAEKTAGVAISGTAAAGATVLVTWNGITKTAIADSEGLYTTDIYTTDEIPADTANSEIRATQTTTAGYTVTAIRNVVVDTTAPVIDSAVSDNFIENGTGPAYTINAIDVSRVTYSISGTDAHLFHVDPTSGAVSFNTPPNFESQNDADLNNIYELTVIASDGRSSDSRAVSITILNGNDAPSTMDDSNSVFAGGVVAGDNVLTGASDDDGDTISVSAIGQDAVATTVANGSPGVIISEYGSLTINDDGSYTYTADQSKSRKLMLNESFEDKFTYTARDAAGATSTATLSITINGVDDPPVAMDDSGLAVENVVAANGNVLENDDSVDINDTMTVSDVTGGLVGSALAGTYGMLILDSTGSYTYEVDNDNASVNALRTVSDTVTDVFTYTMRDAAGALSTATLTMTIQGANDAPVAAPIANQDTAAGSAISGLNIAGNFSDPDSGDTLTYSLASGAPAWVSIDSTTGEISGTPTVAGNYSLTAIATDAAGATASNTFMLNVIEGPQLAASQTIDNVTNLDVGSAIVLTFSQNISLGSGQIRIMDDNGTAGWNLTNSSSGESIQDIYDNDVVLTLSNGAITGFTVGGVDKSAFMTGSVTVSGNKLIINPSGDHGAFGNAAWNFDWDFGANYHVELGAGVVTGTSGLGNAAITDSSLNFSTVTPASDATGAQSVKMNTSTGLLENSYLWHSAHVSKEDSAAVLMDFSGGAHALVIQSLGGSTGQTTLSGRVQIKDFGIDGGVVVANDLIYNDNMGNRLLATTDENDSAAQWLDVLQSGGYTTSDRMLSNSDGGGTGQRIEFDQRNFTGWVEPFVDSDFEAAYNANVIVFG